MTHGLSAMKLEFQTVQTRTLELKEAIFQLVDSDKFKNIAGDRNLIQEKKPEYLELNSKPLTLLQ